MKNLIYLLLLVMMLSGCASLYDRAVRADSIGGWRNFLEKQPNSLQTSEAQQRLDELLSIKQRLQEVKRAHIEYTGDFEDLKFEGKWIGDPPDPKEDLRFIISEVVRSQGWVITDRKPQILVKINWKASSYFDDAQHRIETEIKFYNDNREIIDKSYDEITWRSYTMDIETEITFIAMFWRMWGKYGIYKRPRRISIELRSDEKYEYISSEYIVYDSNEPFFPSIRKTLSRRAKANLPIIYLSYQKTKDYEKILSVMAKAMKEEDFEIEQEAKTMEINYDIYEVIQEYGKENKYGKIYDSRMPNCDEEDITEEIINILNARYIAKSTNE